MMATHDEKVARLRARGVTIPAPHSIEIGDEVDLDRIAGDGTTLHTATKLYGAKLSVGPGCVIGAEAPAAVRDCALGARVALKGGSFEKSVFLDDASMGSGAQIRAGTIVEEEANGAHTVGLKQTVLLPFVTLGSLVNFCDILMAGGTSRKDHSEVGSSFIHFNFTPFGKSGDKATASLVGDVPRGVMLREKRIFLGGQGGLVGPVHIDYGTVLAAGGVYRRDYGPDELVVLEPLSPGTRAFDLARFGRIADKVRRNLAYIGNLAALWHFYDRVRVPGARTDHERAAVDLARELVASNIEERIKRLGAVAGYMPASIDALTRAGAEPDHPEVVAQAAFAAAWEPVAETLRAFRARAGDALAATALSNAMARAASEAETHTAQIATLTVDEAAGATAWLQTIVDEAIAAGPDL